VLCVLAPSGCGDQSAEESAPGRLSSDERSEVARSQRAIRSYCRLVGLFLMGRNHAPTRAESERVQDAVARLIELARDKPQAAYEEQRTMRQLLGDTAEDLEGTNCSSALVAQLQQGLRSLPAP
jgi:hypothetical protein